MSDVFVRSEFDKWLKTKAIGRSLIYRLTVESTQSRAIKMAEADCNCHGLVIIAEKQNAGKGRAGRTWFSPAGGIWMSAILVPDLTIDQCPLLSFAGGLSVRNAIYSCTGLDAQLKWPNDVLVNGAKVAGILGDVSLEGNEVRYVIVGIGVNVNIHPNKLKKVRRLASAPAIGSLSGALHQQVSRSRLSAEILNELEDYYTMLKSKGTEALISEWKRHSITIGQQVSALTGGRTISGTAIDVGIEGELIIATKSGKQTAVSAGDVRLTNLCPGK